METQHTTDYAKEYLLKLTKEQLEDLSIITQLSQQHVGEIESLSPLDPVILTEIQKLVDTKADKIKKQGTLKINCSQSTVLFHYMQNIQFDHPLFNNLGYTIVDQLFQQTF